MVIGTHGNTQASRDINALRRLALDELKKEEEEFHEAVPVPLNLKSMHLQSEKKKLDNEKLLKKSKSAIESSIFVKHLKNITKSLNVEEKKVLE